MLVEVLVEAVDEDVEVDVVLEVELELEVDVDVGIFEVHEPHFMGQSCWSSSMVTISVQYSSAKCAHCTGSLAPLHSVEVEVDVDVDVVVDAIDVTVVTLSHTAATRAASVTHLALTPLLCSCRPSADDFKKHLSQMNVKCEQSARARHSLAHPAGEWAGASPLGRSFPW